MKKLSLFLFLSYHLFFSQSFFAQIRILSAEEVFEELVLFEEDAFSEDSRDILMDIAEGPINLNATSRKELEQLPFISSIQIEALLNYIQKTEIHSIYELQLVNHFDNNTIEWLLPFIIIGKKPETIERWMQRNKWNKQELFCRLSQVFPQKKGYKTKRYIGEALQHTLRYKFKTPKALNLGLVADKDAGEPFFNKNVPYGYDHYNFYIAANSYKIIDKLVLGDYKVGVGRGLIINNGAFYGKNTAGTNTGYVNSGIKYHYSSDEVNYLRGIAAQIHYRQTKYLFFYSSRWLDSYQKEKVVLSLSKSGYHRTLSDFDKKNNVRMQTIGSTITQSFMKGEIGLTFLHYKFNKLFSPKEKAYNKYYFRGKENKNIGIHYRYHYYPFHFFGELAFSSNGKCATLHSLQTTLSNNLSLLATFRCYDKAYHAFFANGYHESAMNNETGFLLSIEYLPFWGLKLTSYIDVFHFPYLKYGIDAPSSGVDSRFALYYYKSKKWNCKFDFRIKKKAKNSKDKIRLIDSYYQYKSQLSFIYYPQENFEYRSRISFSQYKMKSLKSTSGKSIGETFLYKTSNKKAKVRIQGTYFDTDNYQNRIFIYDYKGLYSSLLSSYYDKGVNFALSVNYICFKHLSTCLHYSLSHYFNRKKIGTGLEETQGDNRSDCLMSFLYKF